MYKWAEGSSGAVWSTVMQPTTPRDFLKVALQRLDQITHGAAYHRADVLLEMLRNRGVFLTVELAKRMRRFDWTTDLRYEIGRKDTGETNGMLRTARAIYEWVEEQMP